MAGGAALVGFWSLVIAGVVETGASGSTLHEFEMAFPIADGMLGSLLFFAGVSLFKGRARGGFCLAAAAGMAIYLGILDVTFYARQGMYWPLTGHGLFELAINAACVGGGLSGLRYSWMLWQSQTRSFDVRTRIGRTSGWPVPDAPDYRKVA
jgi:hypothetical protein